MEAQSSNKKRCRGRPRKIRRLEDITDKNVDQQQQSSIKTTRTDDQETNELTEDDDEEDIWWYICLICHRAFETDKSFKRHVKSVHPFCKYSNGLIVNQTNLLPSIKLYDCCCTSTSSSIIRDCSDNYSSPSSSEIDDSAIPRPIILKIDKESAAQSEPEEPEPIIMMEESSSSSPLFHNDEPARGFEQDDNIDDDNNITESVVNEPIDNCLKMDQINTIRNGIGTDNSPTDLELNQDIPSSPSLVDYFEQSNNNMVLIIHRCDNQQLKNEPISSNDTDEYNDQMLSREGGFLDLEENNEENNDTTATAAEPQDVPNEAEETVARSLPLGTSEADITTTTTMILDDLNSKLDLDFFSSMTNIVSSPVEQISRSCEFSLVDKINHKINNHTLPRQISKPKKSKKESDKGLICPLEDNNINMSSAADPPPPQSGGESIPLPVHINVSSSDAMVIDTPNKVTPRDPEFYSFLDPSLYKRPTTKYKRCKYKKGNKPNGWSPPIKNKLNKITTTKQSSKPNKSRRKKKNKSSKRRKNIIIPLLVFGQFRQQPNPNSSETYKSHKIKEILLQLQQQYQEEHLNVVAKKPKSKYISCLFCPCKFLTDSELKSHNKKQRNAWTMNQRLLKSLKTEEELKGSITTATTTEEKLSESDADDDNNDNEDDDMAKSSKNDGDTETFKCILCAKKKYSTLGGLNTHACTAHLFPHQSLTKHSLTTTRRTRPPCFECGKRFRDLKKHRRRHAEWRRRQRAIDHEEDDEGVETLLYNCSHCPKGFTSIKHLADHIYNAHTEHNQWICAICGRQCSSQDTLNKHTSTHNARDPNHPEYVGHVCRVCGSSYATLNCLQQHVKIKHKPPCHKCKKCDKSFRDQYHVKRHMESCLETGTKTGTYTCSQCPKAYKTKQGLIVHTQSRHAGLPQQHICPHCTKGFKLGIHLKAHMNIVHVEKKWECEELDCGKKYKSSQQLKNHVMAAHAADGKNLAYQCEICGKKFSTNTLLYQHRMAHKYEDESEKKHVCDVCGKKFGFPGHLRQHLKTHQKK